MVKDLRVELWLLSDQNSTRRFLIGRSSPLMAVKGGGAGSIRLF